jgi:hypothetical protein
MLIALVDSEVAVADVRVMNDGRTSCSAVGAYMSSNKRTPFK